VLDDEIRPLLDELEEACAQAEVALRARNWDGLRERLFDQRRVRQAIVNAVAASGEPLDAVPDTEKRLRAILRFRDDQLRRLTAYRNDVSERLQNTRRWRNATRSAQRGMGANGVLLETVQ
jgi:hypothetical protein